MPTEAWQTPWSGADMFVGVSAPNIVTEEMVRSMNRDAIIFAMANPVPEIMPDAAKAAGAKVVGTGRSDFPNQINNVVAFPGIFKGGAGRTGEKDHGGDEAGRRPGHRRPGAGRQAGCGQYHAGGL